MFGDMSPSGLSYYCKALSDTVIECTFLYLKTLLPGLQEITPLVGKSRGRGEIETAPKKEEGKATGIPQIKRRNKQCRM